MTRTKQSARKSTGGKAPRLPLRHRYSDTPTSDENSSTDENSLYGPPVNRMFSRGYGTSGFPLLDLSDEILELIGKHLNSDFNLPIPSFGPHWENFQSEIDSNNSKDYRSYRATCRRIKSICKFDGNHIKIENLGDFLPVKRSAKKRNSKLLLNSVSRALVNMRRNEVSRPIDSIQELILMLRSLPKLEELSIERLPYCTHEHTQWLANGNSDILDLDEYDSDYDDTNIDPKISSPKLDNLPNLQSLSITIRCESCSNEILNSLIPISPKLQHLKYTLSMPEGENVNDWDPIETLQIPFKEWCKENKENYLPLKSLYLKYPSSNIPNRPEIGSSWSSVMKTIFEIFPKLENLSVSQAKSNNDFMSRFQLEVTGMKDMNGMNVIHENPNAGIRLLYNEHTNWYAQKFLPQWISEISPSTTLKYFDPGFTIKLDQPFPFISKPQVSQKKSEYRQKNHDDNSISTKGNGDYDFLLRRNMNCIIMRLIKYIPSLEGGAFWKKGTIDNENDWYRWEWKKSNNIRNIDENGEVEIELDEKACIYGADFLRMKS